MTTSPTVSAQQQEKDEHLEYTPKLYVEHKSLWQRFVAHPIAPFAVAAAVIVGGFAGYNASQNGDFSLSGLLSSPSSYSEKVVTFDPVLFLNAQRAAASILAVAPSAELALTMTQVAKQAEAVIEKVANGRLVLIKQAVVLADNYQDITPQVIEHFGLPSAAPTISNTLVDESSIRAIAPTDMSFGVLQSQEEQRESSRGAIREIQSELDLLDKQINLLP